VKRRREALKLSQGEVARRAGMAQGLLSRIEAGQTPNPGLQVIKGLALALRCSIDWLVGLYDDDPAYAFAASPSP